MKKNLVVLNVNFIRKIYCYYNRLIIYIYIFLTLKFVK